MRRAFPDAEVRGYENLVETMTCDPKDRHVLAAAVRSDAAVLVTFNTDDFPDTSTAAYGITVLFPGEHRLGFTLQVDIWFPADVDDDAVDGASGECVRVVAWVVAGDWFATVAADA
jgi:hypothetical protein